MTTRGVKLAGENGNVTLDDVSTSHFDDTITATLNATQRTTVGDTMTLSVSAGAVADPSGNGISAAPNQPVTIMDGIRPTIQSTSYNTDGLLHIRFSEPLDHTATDYTKLTVTGQSGSVTLDQVATKTATYGTIRATLNAAQAATIGTAATLHVGEGAVSDPAGNDIAQATKTLVLTILGLPLLEMRPVASVVDDTTTELNGAFRSESFETGGRTYAIVVAPDDYGIQILNITDPASPAALAHISDNSTTNLAYSLGVDVFAIGGRTYAIVTAWSDNGIQILNVTDPASPAALAHISDEFHHWAWRGARRGCLCDRRPHIRHSHCLVRQRHPDTKCYRPGQSRGARPHKRRFHH